MTIEAKVIADSISEAGVRLTTLQLVYPRFIHAEFMTHRVFSRNASSSRAIPVAKMIEQVRTNPAMPIHWGKNQAGMQAKEELSDAFNESIGTSERQYVKNLWMHAAELAAMNAERMSQLGAHKQVVNRLLEPFQHIHVVMTSTEFDNFFELRAHEDAQPEIQALAYAMRDAMNASTPKLIRRGEWHLPYVTEDERNDAYFQQPENRWLLPKISAARCARVSYLKHDGAVPSIEEDLTLFQRLAGAQPIHASPLEHAATPGPNPTFTPRTRNFRGWQQFRAFYEEHMNVQAPF